ncbi:MAG: zf-TFIIB domain-containing protein [Motiliproteus sp.]|nr:zf-TFIIB domain-containing protein [Motiliproteus sp.]MCW9052025.1 zf-TFIIB domain-containing protein [Motiliproteus sp.]
MNCPRCCQGLAAPTHNDSKYLYCHRCDGAWLDYSQLLRLLPYNQVDAFFNALAASIPGLHLLCCPSCKQCSLNPFNYSEVKLDGCPICQGVYIESKDTDHPLPVAEKYEKYQALADAQSAYQFFQSIAGLLESLRSRD